MIAAVNVEPSAAVLHTLSVASGLRLESFHPDHVRSCLTRALVREGVSSPEALAGRIRAEPAARTRFRRSVAISMTGLFRDPAQFDVLAELLTPLAERKGRLRVWSAGCADGTELASVALLLDRLGVLDRCFLLGSDLLEENIRQARSGSSLPASLAGRLRWELRDLVADGPPAGRWNVVLCRNVTIYLAPETKRSLHVALAATLAAGGILLVGRSERIADPGSLGLEVAGPHAYRRRGP